MSPRARQAVLNLTAAFTLAMVTWVYCVVFIAMFGPVK